MLCSPDLSTQKWVGNILDRKGIDMMGGFGMGGLGGFGALFGMGVSLLLFVGLIVLVVWGISQLTRSGPQVSSAGAGSAVEILNARYARGEITKAEYDQMKTDLR